MSEGSQEGEKRVYRIINAAFGVDESSFNYFQPAIGDKRPDFIIITPMFGAVIIEVKGYSSDSITQTSEADNWILNMNGKETHVRNPFNQIFDYWQILRKRLDSKIVSRDQHVPLNQLIIFPFISRKGMVRKVILGLKVQRCNILFKEDLVNVQVFKRCLMDIYPNDYNLSLDELNSLRGRLINTSTLPHPNQPKKLDDFFPSEVVLKVLDHEQEEIAYNLGEGHRLIFGVAGSGKTILLVARADFLARIHTDWRILILCYNRLLGGYLHKLIKPQTYHTEIEINSFHKWAKELIFSYNRKYRIEYNEKWELVKKKQLTKDYFFEKYVPDLLLEVIIKESPEKYDAILIDEAQDFEKNWFIPLMKLLNPETNSLLITCDGLQGIYARKRFYWKEAGIQAQGRVKKFYKTYRNPSSIGKLAFQFIVLDSNFNEMIKTEEEFLEPQEFAREGGDVKIKVLPSKDEELTEIINFIKSFQAYNWSILILYPKDLEKIKYNHPLIKKLNEVKIEWFDLKEKGLGKTGVYIGTLQGTKGLEADAVIIPEIESLRSNAANRQLLYVGMTRALHHLVLTATEKTEFVKNLISLTKEGSLESKQVNEILQGKRCFFCKKIKKANREQPLCYDCWENLLDQKICGLCGAAIVNNIQNNDGVVFTIYTCNSCDNEISNQCKICNTPIKLKKGKPLCYSCYNRIKLVWDQAKQKAMI